MSFVVLFVGPVCRAVVLTFVGGREAANNDAQGHTPSLGGWVMTSRSWLSVWRRPWEQLGDVPEQHVLENFSRFCFSVCSVAPKVVCTGRAGAGCGS